MLNLIWKTTSLLRKKVITITITIIIIIIIIIIIEIAQ